MKRAKLVSVRVAHIRQVESPEVSFAQTRGLFDRSASVGDCSVVKLGNLFRGIALEPDSAAIGARCCFAIDRLADAEGDAVMAIEQSDMACVRFISDGFTNAKYAEHRVIKAFRTLDIV